ncbi:MAG: hypothetical protein ABSG70_18330 [Terriglobales bacterium]|jgi:hypothetical protein
MAALKKKGKLTEADLATYGILPKPKSGATLLKRPSEKKVVSIIRS